ncbi:hypothetical protein [Bacillus suaedae]|uniref:YneQ n=1 Tax=Halalkalibacter suaedae TaxID=2822140 RepID=A0A941APL6_9BACI|nr:hypothetical protein [Bacillus suaedae]MBP3952915.1 hypothetical protein [Bacillus suaedae]
MAFGISRKQLNDWKKQAQTGQIAFITHYWLDDRFPECSTVTKVACADLDKLITWGERHGLKAEWIHQRDHYPHFDLLGERQRQILVKEGLEEQLNRLL